VHFVCKEGSTESERASLRGVRNMKNTAAFHHSLGFVSFLWQL
jgi:hypothetical protein